MASVTILDGGMGHHLKQRGVADLITGGMVNHILHSPVLEIPRLLWQQDCHPKSSFFAGLSQMLSAQMWLWTPILTSSLRVPRCVAIMHPHV